MVLTSQQIVIIAVVVVLAIALIAWFASRNSHSQRERLRRRFGPEYDRAIEQYGSAAKAERMLMDRARRIEKFHVRPLSEADRTRLGASWRTVQARFVDDPSGAVREANELIKTVMHTRGYPVEEFEQRVADLSVDHAGVVQHYRAARVLAEANREGRANTEDLRQAFVHYRALFADLLDEASTQPHGLREVRV
jgi:hypothetical protein